MKDIQKLKCWNRLKDLGFQPVRYKFRNVTQSIGASLYKDDIVPGRVLVDIRPNKFQKGYTVMVDQYYYHDNWKEKTIEIQSILKGRKI